MSLAGLVLWAVFALLIGFLGMVLYATSRQIAGEAREAAKRDD